MEKNEKVEKITKGEESRTKQHLYILKQFSINAKRIKESGLLNEEEKKKLEEIQDAAMKKYITG